MTPPEVTAADRAADALYDALFGQQTRPIDRRKVIATALATVRAEERQAYDAAITAARGAMEDARILHARVTALEAQLDKYTDPSRWP